MATDLPDEAWMMCLEHVLPEDLFVCMLTCHQLYNCANTDSSWKRLCLTKWSGWPSGKDSETNSPWKITWIRRTNFDSVVLPLLTEISTTKIPTTNCHLSHPLLSRMALLAPYVIERLESIRQDTDPYLSFKIKSWASYFICKSNSQNAIAQWKQLFSDPAHATLEKGAVIIATLWFPKSTDEIERSVFSTLDSLAAEAKTHFTPTMTTYQKFETVNSFFRNKFQGNTTNYYDEGNSLINVVLKRGKGIPISLCLVYHAICRRLGLEVRMIGAPSHFLAQIICEKQKLFLDVYDGCRILDDEATLDIPSEYLNPVSDLKVWTRMINNRAIGLPHNAIDIIFKYCLFEQMEFLLFQSGEPTFQEVKMIQLQMAALLAGFMSIVTDKD